MRRGKGRRAPRAHNGSATPAPEYGFLKAPESRAGIFARLALVLAALTLAPGCPGEPSRTEKALVGDSPGATVRVLFDRPGDDIGDEESQEALRRIRERVLAGTNAEIVRSGFGMGSMELVLKLGPGDSAEKLRGAIREADPGARYRIEGGAP